jgi:hypothetical protein
MPYVKNRHPITLKPLFLLVLPCNDIREGGDLTSSPRKKRATP